MKILVFVLSYLIAFILGFIAGYFVKDNYTKEDTTNYIRQRGRGNKILGFFKRNRKDTTSR